MIRDGDSHCASGHDLLHHDVAPSPSNFFETVPPQNSASFLT